MTEIVNEPPSTSTQQTPAGRVGSPRRSSASKLRTVLRINALSSVLTGIALAVIPDRVDDLLDTGNPGWLRVVGLAFLPFAALCAWLSTASVDTLRRMTPEIIALDVTYVVASVATVLVGWYSGGGVVVVLAAAALVDAFALLQWAAWRQLPATR